MSFTAFGFRARLLGVTLLLVLSIPGAVTLSLAHSSITGGSSTVHPVLTSASEPGSAPPPARSGSPAAPTHQPSAAPSTFSANCAARQMAWNLTHADARPPRMVLQSLQGSCPIGHDEPILNFVSNATYSGSNVQFVIDLPSNRTNVASAFSTFWVGMWLSGVPCSYRGQSYLQVQFNPPFSSLGVSPDRNWTVQAPVWDLVPAGSCDPRCQNTTVTTTIDGIGYCEEDAAISGVGTYSTTGWGAFAPGDRLAVQMAGQVGGTSGLTVRVNDTAAPSRSLSWTYSATVSASGRPLTPYYNASGWSNGGWAYGLNVGMGWVNCPSVDGPTACNTYDRPALASVDLPRIVSVTYWNGTTSTFSDPFPWTATASSSGACSGVLASVSPCRDFTAWGGTGSYPYWSVSGAAGNASWSLGGAPPLAIGNYGGASGQFAPLGAPPTYLSPSVMGPVSVGVGVMTDTVNAAFADPNGIVRVQVGDYWCNATGVPVVKIVNATLGVGPLNTSFSGNWSAPVNRNGLWHGTVHYWFRAESTSGAWGPTTFGNLGFAGGGSACVFPIAPTPWFGVSNITPVAGGYRLTWTENSTAVRNFTVWLNATQNGTPFGVSVGPAPTATVLVPNSSASYRIAITAYDDQGVGSNRTPWVAGPPPLQPLVPRLAGPNTTVLWLGRSSATFLGNLTGGTGPFTYQFTFSDGTTTTFPSANRSVVVRHDFGGYFGNALVGYHVVDAFGSVADSNPLLVRVWATPLGVPQNISGGDGWVNVSWTSPSSPAAPVTHYTVFYTTNASSAGALTLLWPNNASSLNGSREWNTTQTSLLIPVVDGTTLYAQVVAWNQYGAGLLPATALPGSVSPILSGTPARLTLSTISTLPGGPAPFTDPLSAFVTGGTNFAVASAVYSFPGGAAITPTVQMVSGGAWVNASFTFLSPGAKTIVLHVSDVLFDTAIGTTSVLVTVGVGPSVTISTTTPSSWVGSAVTFTAVASSGSGNYSYLWSFGDGASGSGSSTSHAFPSAGTFLVLVAVTDGENGGTTERNVSEIVYALPSVSISTSEGPNGSASYAFQAVSSGGSSPLTIVWAFGDGTVGHGRTAQHDFGSSGTYTVSVIATDLSNRAAYANVTLNVVTGGNVASGISPLSTESLALLILLASAAILFLVGMLYFWSQARESSRTTAIEPVDDAPRPPPEP